MRGAAAILVDASIRDREELGRGLPIWASFVRVTGAVKDEVGAIDEPVEVGGAVINPGDLVVLDSEAAVAVGRERVPKVLDAARQRAERERVKRAKVEAGALSYDLDGLRDLVEGSTRS